jgi:hypothetical protein
MKRIVDPEISFFLRADIPSRRAPTTIYNREIVWRTERSRRNSSKRLTAQIREAASYCTFRPELTDKAMQVRSSFASRLRQDLRYRENSKTISEFLRKQRIHDEMNFPFRPNLSLTQSFTFSNYVTRKIKIPY